MTLAPCRTCLLIAIATVFPAASSAVTLPPGRAWAPVVPLTPSSVIAIATANLARDAYGRPALIAGVVREGETSPTWAVLAWRDSSWRDSIWSQQPIGQSTPQIPQAPDGARSLLAISRQMDVNGYFRLSLWPLGDQVAGPETVAVATSQLGTFAFSAALTPGRRWVSRIEQPPGETFQVRTYFSDAPGVWQAAPRQGADEVNCAITALDGTTALLVYTGFQGTWWSKLEGTQWTPRQAFPRPTEAPRFVLRPAGGWWLISEDRFTVHVDAWNGSGWDAEAVLQAIREPGRGFIHIGWMETSLEDGGRPAIAWQENWAVGIEWHSAAHIAWPTETGWTGGYQVPQSDTMGIGPTVTTDRNGDAWLVWSRDHSAVHMWTHSYVTAITGTPAVIAVGSGFRIDWSLSENAPESWWAVLRDPGTGVFGEIARVRASSGASLSWLDPSPQHTGSGPLRYRVRRESVDARYAWVSPVGELRGDVSVPPAGTSGLRLIAARNPVGARSTLQLHASEPGFVDILVHDVSGRRISSARVQAGPDAQPVPLDLSRQAHGVYLVIARDARGLTSPVIRLVRLD